MERYNEINEMKHIYHEAINRDVQLEKVPNKKCEINQNGV